jgi:hypothetical protein
MAGNVVNPTQVKAKLTQAGCPTAQADQLAPHLQSAGVSADQLSQLASVSPTFNWGVLASLVQQFGPQIITGLIALFGAGQSGAGAGGGGGQQP